MKLVVQIPCYNEEATLPQTLSAIPRQLRGIDEVEILVIDDGSTDRTAEIAAACGADHIVRHRRNQGLARAFRTGLHTSLERGADIIVNTDADNQYAGSSIAALIGPILDGRADIVTGDRQTDELRRFSLFKRLLQKLGSAMVRRLSGTDVPDAVSGFRALSREAALRINIVSRFSYTIEMLIQAGNQRMALASVPVQTQSANRPSRLARSTGDFVRRSLGTMFLADATYRPLRMFAALGVALVILGLLPVGRFLYLDLTDHEGGHTQSLVLGGVLITLGFSSLVSGLIAHLVGVNRQLLEMVLESVRRVEMSSRAPHRDPAPTQVDRRVSDRPASGHDDNHSV